MKRTKTVWLRNSTGDLVPMIEEVWESFPVKDWPGVKGEKMATGETGKRCESGQRVNYGFFVAVIPYLGEPQLSDTVLKSLSEYGYTEIVLKPRPKSEVKDERVCAICDAEVRWLKKERDGLLEQLKKKNDAFRAIQAAINGNTP